MTKNTHKNNSLQTRMIKRYLAALGIMLISVALVVCIASTTATTPSGQTMKDAGSETQFKLNIDYAYVGQGPPNASYVAANGARMAPITDYPSAIVINTTRLPGNQIAACDAVMEVYKVQITTDTGIVENHCYNIGTNYNPSLLSADLSALFDHVADLGALSGSAEIRGNFQLNWTQNTSMLSHSVGSVGCYSNISRTTDSVDSSNGLWRAGVPNAISVTVQRIGYITVSDGSVSVYKDSSDNITTMKQLSDYENGFLYNSLVSAEKISQTDLFHPIS
jgi:hypothetical protein